MSDNDPALPRKASATSTKRPLSPFRVTRAEALARRLEKNISSCLQYLSTEVASEETDAAVKEIEALWNASLLFKHRQGADAEPLLALMQGIAHAAERLTDATPASLAQLGRRLARGLEEDASSGGELDETTDPEFLRLAQRVTAKASVNTGRRHQALIAQLESTSDQSLAAVASHLLRRGWPEHAALLDPVEIATAVRLWTRKRGTRSDKLSKWKTVAALVRNAGFGRRHTPGSLRQLWIRSGRGKDVAR